MMKCLVRVICVLFALISMAQAKTPTVIVSQIHNAPGWLPNHAYGATTDPAFHAGHTRVNSGPGWNPATQHFVSYRPLSAYQLTSGACRSGSKEIAGIGSAIADGTCTWKYLSKTDYVTLSGWNADNGVHWKSGTTYTFYDVVLSGSPLAAYVLQNKPSCVSTVKPTGGHPGILSDGCRWKLWAYITYTSGAATIPTETFDVSSLKKFTIHVDNIYKAQLWNDREYVDGQNGESNPIVFGYHNSRFNDHYGTVCPGGTPNDKPCFGWPFIVTPAPGESFRDTELAIPQPLVGYDPSKGVGIRGVGTKRYGSDAIEITDNAYHFIGLQIDSSGWLGLGGNEARSCNFCQFLDGIAQASWTPIFWGAGATISDSLLVIRHPAPGAVGVFNDYPGAITHTTVVCPEGCLSDPTTTGIETGWNFRFAGLYVSNVAVFGFSHLLASRASCGGTYWKCIRLFGDHNYTDVAAPDGNSWKGWLRGKKTLHGYRLPGTTYGTPAKTTFKKWPGDYRAAGGSPLIAGGAAFGDPIDVCPINYACYPVNQDTPDILGTPRPTGTRWDVGAWQNPSLNVTSLGRP